MKKRYILAIIVFLSFQAQAQQHDTSALVMEQEKNTIEEDAKLKDDLRWGIKAGANYYNLYGKDIDFIFANQETLYKASFHIGLFVDTRLSNKFGLKHELLFNQRKVGVSLADDTEKIYESTMTRNYLDLMPASITFQQGGLQLFAGPYISALLGANVKRKDENGKWYADKDIYGDGANDESKTRYLQKLDFGLNLGMEYYFKNNLSLGARYLHGFTDLFQYANSYTQESSKTDAIKIYNRGWMLSCGYRF